LIDDFKDWKNSLTIAISVDMLDTGIDVPEVVNLVFAKPIKSKVKFWQMIGRGTRLCPNLFGQGKHKSVFRIFDHWGNFEYFETSYQPVEFTNPKSLMQQVFEARLALADTALREAELDIFIATVADVRADILALPDDSIRVRERWREVRSARDQAALEGWSPAVTALLRADIPRAPAAADYGRRGLSGRRRRGTEPAGQPADASFSGSSSSRAHQGGQGADLLDAGEAQSRATREAPDRLPWLDEVYPGKPWSYSRAENA
jgi:hypothetical protein